MLEESTIRDLAEPRVYERGLMYYRQNRVLNLTPGKKNSFSAEVTGSDIYRVQIGLSARGSDVFDYECDCPAAQKSFAACKHVIAVLKAIQYQQEEHIADTMDDSADTRKRPRRTKQSSDTYQSGARMLALFRKKAESKPPQILTLEPCLYVQHYYNHSTAWMELRIGEDRMYVMKNILGFLQAAASKASFPFGKKLTVDTSVMKFSDERSQKLWQMLLKARHEMQETLAYESFYNRYSFVDTSFFQQKRFYLPPRYLEEYLSCMGNQPFPLLLNDNRAENVQVTAGNPALRISVQDQKGAGIISFHGETIISLDNDYRFLLSENRIYISDRNFQELARPLFHSFMDTKRIHVSKDHMAAFLGTVLPKLETIAQVDLPQSLSEKFLLEPLHGEFYLDYYQDGIEVRPSFRYGSTAFNPLLEEAPLTSEQLTLVREEEKEDSLLALFDTYGFFRKDGCFLQPDEDKAYDFLTEALPQLSEEADIFYAESFRRKPIQTMTRITAGVSVNDNDLLEMKLHADNIDFDEILDILSSYRKKQRYHRMKDGTFITLEEQQLSAVAELVESVGIKKGHLQDEAVEIPLSQAMYLDTLAREEDGIRLERSSRFKSMIRDIRHPGESELEVPPSLSHTLRDYQVMGFSWLSTLASYGLGGILADDMGLGKTLQVLSFLLARMDQEKAPALIVVPTSLMYNWADEIQRFTPELAFRLVNGTKEERTALLDSEDRVHILLTTYNLLARDLELYREKSFSYCFLDEAQHIKNPATQKAKAVKEIRARVCFALTGTPIENTLTELWSIFDFLMPGYLRSHAKFKQHYETPIVRAQDEHAAKDLKRHVTPFILRRLKRDVLKELPDKVERRITNEMTEAQTKVYRAYFVQAKKEFAEELKKRGLGESRIKILALLTRLRQIACDPSLFLEDYTGGSGKLDLLGEIISDAAASGHRMLIFSQFTSMLQHIATWLDDQDMDYLYLDGQTPSMERIRLVKRFNEGQMPIFLISLKAGGTGLNLTGADMVIHYDPWWNPAVEDQATDRAYRLGQQNNVQVLKLITKNTIEEKIYELQEKKKSLIDRMIEPGGNFLSKLTDEEIRELFS